MSMGRTEQLELLAWKQALEAELRRELDSSLKKIEDDHAEDRKVIMKFIEDLRVKLQV